MELREAFTMAIRKYRNNVEPERYNKDTERVFDRSFFKDVRSEYMGEEEDSDVDD